MTDTSSEWFEAPGRTPDDEVMYVDVDGYEGPLDLLLDLARRQKVDLAAISVLALAEQYLRLHRDGAREAHRDRRRLSRDGGVAGLSQEPADGAAVPQRRRADRRDDGGAAAVPAEAARGDAPGGQPADEPAAPRPRRSIARGAPEPITIQRRSLWEASLFDLLKAYATQRERGVPQRLRRCASARSGRCRRRARSCSG